MDDTRRAVLRALADGPVSARELAEGLAIPRASVREHLEALRAAGFEIAGGEEGYEVLEIPEYGGPALEYGLDAPFDVEYHDALASTNDRARELAAAGAADVAVVADEQTGGRGRLDRQWSSPSGGVWLSLVLRPDLPPAEVPLVTLAAAVAVTRAATEVGVDAGIKWPNDVLVPTGAGERKLAGVLTEVETEGDRVEWVVVGVGVNANVDAETLPGGATSLREQVGDVDRRTFVQRLLETFADVRSDPGAILDAWHGHALTLGRRVRVETPGGTVIGEALRVEQPGTLVVATDDGERRVHAGDCDHLRPVE